MLTPYSFWNVPPIAEITSVSANTFTIKGKWALPSAPQYHRMTVSTERATFRVRDVYIDSAGDSVIIVDNPIHGKTAPKYLAVRGLEGDSLYADRVSDLSSLPDEVRIMVAGGALPPVPYDNDQYTGTGPLPEAPKESSDKGVLTGGTDNAMQNATIAPKG